MDNGGREVPYHERKYGEFRSVGVVELWIADGIREGGRGKGLEAEQLVYYKAHAGLGSARPKELTRGKKKYGTTVPLTYRDLKGNNHMTQW